MITERLAKILPKTPVPNGVDPRFLSRDPQVVANYNQDPLVHRVVTARCAIVLRKALEDSKTLAGKLKLPCLILQAGEDRICDPQASVEFAMAATQASVTLRRYDGLYHEVFNEPERSRVIQDLIGWMEEILTG